MKKVLSILLAVAMIVSCISIISFAADTTGIEISGDGAYGHMRTPGIGNDVQKAVNAVAGGNGKGKITVYAHNTGDKTVTLNVYMQNNWSTINGTSSVKATMNPGESAKYDIWFNVKNGKMLNGNAEQDMSVLSLRTDLDNFNSVQGAKFIIWSPDISTATLKNMDSTGRTKTEVAVPDKLNIPVKKVVNGDAENSTTGWSNFAASGGSVEQVEGGANGTAHAMKFVPNNSAFSSIAFNLGPAIVKDEANNYVGGGAGTYKVSFYAKADAGKGGEFSFVLNSQFHKQPGNLETDLTAAEYEKIKDVVANTYINAKSGLKMTDQWQKYEVDVKVTEEFLTLITSLYSMGYTNAADLVLRIDAHDGFFKTERFNYYVDEVTIEKLAEETPTPGVEEGDATPTPGGEATPTPKVATGFNVTFNEDSNTDHYIISAAGVLSSSEVKNGKLTRKFTVQNNGEEDVNVKVEFQVLHKKADGTGTWAGPHAGEFVTIPAGENAVIEYTMDVNADGTVTVENSGATANYDISKFFIRFNLNQGELPEGTSVTFFCDEATAKAFTEKVQMAAKDKATLSLTYASPKDSGDMIPVAFVAIAVLASAALIVVSRKKREF